MMFLYYIKHNVQVIKKKKTVIRCTRNFLNNRKCIAIQLVRGEDMLTRSSLHFTTAHKEQDGKNYVIGVLFGCGNEKLLRPFPIVMGFSQGQYRTQSNAESPRGRWHPIRRPTESIKCVGALIRGKFYPPTIWRSQADTRRTR